MLTTSSFTSIDQPAGATRITADSAQPWMAPYVYKLVDISEKHADWMNE
jgi:hypothetical protein